MRIASVGYDSRLKFLGGAPTAAVAFYYWVLDLGHEASLYTFTGSGYPYDDDLSLIWGVPYKCRKWSDFVAVLNSYDFVYFSSPFGIAYKRDTQTFYVEHYKKLEKPFVIHIHGEYDERYYDLKLVDEILKLPNCAGLVVMINGFWDHLCSEIGKPVYPFHPCTMPWYTISEPEAAVPANPNSKGILFAHRFASVKRPHHLAEGTHNERLMNALGHKVVASGVGNAFYFKWEDDRVTPLNPVWERIRRFHNIYDPNYMADLYGGIRYFWNVSGSRDTHYVLKRLDLTGFEAIAMGLIPWVNREYCPDWLDGHCVKVTIDKPWDWDDVASQVEAINSNYEWFYRQMIFALCQSSYSYRGVYNMVQNIITGEK